MSSHFIKCSTYVHFKGEPLTSLCRLPPWLTGGNIAESLRVDKNGVAVGKVDLVFVLFFLYGTVILVYHRKYIIFFKKNPSCKL